MPLWISLAARGECQPRNRRGPHGESYGAVLNAAGSRPLSNLPAWVCLCFCRERLACRAARWPGMGKLSLACRPPIQGGSRPSLVLWSRPIATRRRTRELSRDTCEMNSLTGRRSHPPNSPHGHACAHTAVLFFLGSELFAASCASWHKRSNSERVHSFAKMYRTWVKRVWANSAPSVDGFRHVR